MSASVFTGDSGDGEFGDVARAIPPDIFFSQLVNASVELANAFLSRLNTGLWELFRQGYLLTAWPVLTHLASRLLGFHSESQS